MIPLPLIENQIIHQKLIRAHRVPVLKDTSWNSDEDHHQERTEYRKSIALPEEILPPPRCGICQSESSIRRLALECNFSKLSPERRLLFGRRVFWRPSEPARHPSSSSSSSEGETLSPESTCPMEGADGAIPAEQRDLQELSETCAARWRGIRKPRELVLHGATKRAGCDDVLP